MELTSSILQNPAFKHNQEMQQICKGLFRRFDLNAFSYSRVYADGSRAELWTDAHALEHSFFLKKHISRVYTPYLFNGQRFVFYDVAVEEFPDPVKQRISYQLKDQKELFNHANCLFLIEYQQIYTEYFAFYTPVNRLSAFNNYLNNRDGIEKFSHYFRKRARALISAADTERLIKPWIVSEPSNQGAIKPRLILPNKKPVLTTREKEVADLLCEGLTAKESANMLHISFKTVEKHLENIKRKFGVEKKSKLLNLLLFSDYE